MVIVFWFLSEASLCSQSYFRPLRPVFDTFPHPFLIPHVMCTRYLRTSFAFELSLLLGLLYTLSRMVYILLSGRMVSILFSSSWWEIRLAILIFDLFIVDQESREHMQGFSTFTICGVIPVNITLIYIKVPFTINELLLRVVILMHVDFSEFVLIVTSMCNLLRSFIILPSRL